jgi:trehalose 6-phosphate phosphatase
VTAPVHDLTAAVRSLADRPQVLVATDFDGTLAPLVTDPTTARAVDGGMEALRAAAAMPGVTVALVSGRDVGTLRELSGVSPQEPIVLVGSHGAHTSLDDEDDTPLLSPAQADLLSQLAADVEAVVARHPGARLERKPASVAVHTRGLEPATAAAALEDAAAVPSRHDGVHVKPGKQVVELAVLATNKGTALVDLARRRGAGATLYLGDDVTDERAFEALDPARGDVTVKVGTGETAAAYRVDDVPGVVATLELFVDARSQTT